MAKTNTGAVGAAYSKEQLSRSQKYANSKDLISALLNDGETYTLEQVEDKLIADYKKGKVR